MFKLLKMSFEIIFVVRGYHVYKDIWEVKINLEYCLFYLSQVITKIVMPQQSFNCFQAAGIASLAALVVAKGSASDNRPSLPSGF